MGRGQVGPVDTAGVEPVQIEETRSGLAQVSGCGRQERARPHHIAAGRLTLQTLAEPQQRWPGAIELGGPLDQLDGYACRCLAPRRGAIAQQWLDLVPANGV